MEAVQSSVDHKYMTLKLFEFWARNDSQFLIGGGLKVGNTYVHQSWAKPIQLRDKWNQLDTSKGDNTRVDAVQYLIGQVSCFVFAIMFN